MTHQENWKNACEIYRNGNVDFEPVVRSAGRKLGMSDKDIDGHLEAYRLLYGVKNEKLFARTHPHLSDDLGPMLIGI